MQAAGGSGGSRSAGIHKNCSEPRKPAQAAGNMESQRGNEVQPDTRNRRQWKYQRKNRLRGFLALEQAQRGQLR